MEKELWKPISGYEGLYEVSNLGRVKSLERNIPQRDPNGIVRNHIHKERLLVPLNNGNGYMYVGLFKNQKCKKIAIHRLVAIAFVDNPNNYNVVNHIDSNSQNNKASNLEWCNQEYNVKYQYSKNNRKPTNTRKIQQIENGVVIKIYDSQWDASRKTGIKQSNLWACLNGKQKKAKGYEWRYVNE